MSGRASRRPAAGPFGDVHRHTELVGNILSSHAQVEAEALAHERGQLDVGDQAVSADVIHPVLLALNDSIPAGLLILRPPGAAALEVDELMEKGGAALLGPRVSSMNTHTEPSARRTRAPRQASGIAVTRTCTWSRSRIDPQTLVSAIEPTVRRGCDSYSRNGTAPGSVDIWP